MSALAAAKILKHREEAKIVTLPVVTNDIIYQGALVMINASGYCAPCTPTTGTRFAGIAAETVDNTGGANGAKNVQVFISGLFLFTVTTAVTDLMTDMFAETDNPNDALPVSGSNTQYSHNCGQIVARASSATCWVDIGAGVVAAELTA